jgi:hypothetical protein
VTIAEALTALHDSGLTWRALALALVEAGYRTPNGRLAHSQVRNWALGAVRPNPSTEAMLWPAIRRVERTERVR